MRRWLLKKLLCWYRGYLERRQDRWNDRVSRKLDCVIGLLETNDEGP
jgi:hypothetical protein